ncbi:MAG: DsrE family protein [Sulfuriflexus sp.]|nr:DsrE family protein [Sulfuriflexus sp.]
MRGLIYLFLVVGVAVSLYSLDSSDVRAEDTQPVSIQTAADGVAFDISVHTIDELRDVLQHAETLAQQPKSASQPANIALMLHGPEIKYFSIGQYAQYKDVVDLAAKLDAYNVVELKMCETAMKDFGIEKNDIPSFIEFVPNGDAELKQLSRRGYSIQ